MTNIGNTQQESDIKKRKRVGVITGIFAPDIGGPATHLSECIPTFLGRNALVSVLTFAEKGGMGDEGGVKVTRIQRGSFVLFRFTRFLMGSITLARTCDVLYVHDMSLAGLCARIAHALTGTPYILRLGGDFVWEQAYERSATTLPYVAFQGKEPFPYSLRRKLGVSIASRAESVIVPSGFLARVVESWGINKEKIQVVHNAVSVKESPATISHNLSQEDHALIHDIRVRKKEGKRVVIASGRLIRWKNFDLLVDSARTLPANIHVLIIGGGPLQSHLATRIEQEKRSDRITLYPSVPRAVLQNALALCDCFVLPSIGDTFSFVALEAYLLGTPLLLAREGALPEIFSSAEGAGVTFLDALTHDALTHALADEATYRPPTNEGKEKMTAMYTLSRQCDDVFSTVVKGKKK